jgi:hypothetical protein
MKALPHKNLKEPSLLDAKMSLKTELMFLRKNKEERGF